MSQQIDAIYDHGVLKPLQPLALPDQARVKVTVDSQLGAPSVQVNSGQDDTGLHGGRPAGNGAATDFDGPLEALLFEGPTLPPDFSRADIYADHD
jgi:predicted DNA-binding antitoxin AbrB/MazE fold protein